MLESGRPNYLGRLLEAPNPTVSKEQFLRTKALYLAGIFEAGGGISLSVGTFSTKDGSGHNHSARAAIYFNDENSEAIKSIAGMFGGSASPIKEDRPKNRWVVSDTEKILPILEQIYPYALSRRKEIKIFQNCMGANPDGGKLRFAEDFVRYVRQEKQYPDKEAYGKLLDEPAFLAGVYDARGHFYPTPSSDTFSCVQIGSLNRPLILAMREKFGGSTVTIAEKKEHERLTLTRVDGYRFLHKIGPYRGTQLYKLQTRMEQAAA